MAAESVSAQPRIIRPRRLVSLFDFEEPDNFESLPKNWFIIGRPAESSDSRFFREPLHHKLMDRLGYPSFTHVRFDSRYTISGGRSFYLGLNGGSAGAFLEVGALPAVPQSDYLITAWVRTESLSRSSAYLSAYFVDQQGHQLESTLSQTRPIRTRGQWTQIAVKLRGDVQGAVWLGMEIDIRQPKRRVGDPLGDHRVLLQDIKGEAWFDDIAVWQLPRIEVSTQSKVNILRAPDRPRVDLTVRDLTGQSLIVDVTAYDHTLAPAAHTRRVLGLRAPRELTWEPDLPAYGWYLLEMTVRDRPKDQASEQAVQPPQSPVARTFGAVLWLPPAPPLSSMYAHRFQLFASQSPTDQLEFLPELLETTGIRSTVLSIWEPETTLADIETRKELIDQTMQWLYLSGRTAGLSLDPVPRELAQAMGSPTADPISLLSHDRSQWLAYLTPTLLSHGQRVRRWYLGSSEQAYAFYDPLLPQVVSMIQQRFGMLAPQPELVIPWRLDQSRRPDLSDSLYYLLDTPPGVMANQIPAHMEPWSDAKDRITVFLREPPADRMSHPRRVADLAIRMLTTWEQEPGAIAMADLWTAAAQREKSLVPDPLLGVFANVAQQLAGRRVIGTLHLGGGLRVKVLDGPSGPALVAWSEMPGADDNELKLFLGQNPVVADVWGNQHPVPLIKGKHHLDVSDTPVFITGIDAKLAMFRAGFQIDKPFIESTQTLHDRVITLTNPWPTTISGHMQITGPKEWSSKPSRHYFSLASGRSVKLPVGLSFPVSEVAGTKNLTARFEFTADEPMVIDMALPIEVGLEDVTFNATVALVPGDEPGTEDASAAAVVTNTGNQNLSLYVFANLRGYPIQDRIISDLAPGQTAVRRFRLPDAGKTLRDHAMRIGVREVNGSRMLNKRLSIDDMQ